MSVTTTTNTGNTYTAIATTTLSSAGTVTFNSIPQTYTDLILVFNGTLDYATDAGSWAKLQINGDTGANYSSTYGWGTGSATGTNRLNNVNNAYLIHTNDTNNNTGNTNPSMGMVHFMNYSNTNTYKTYLSRSNAITNNQSVDMVVNLWRSTAAITSLYLYGDGPNYVAGSTYTLYGIKAA